MKNAYNILVGKPEGKLSLWRPKHWWEDNIRMDVTEIGWKGVDWMHLAQWWALMNTVMNLRVPWKQGI